jgi:threonine aldolase
MRAVMAAAEVGDDVFGDDPTVNALQARIASMLGKEAALFVPTGTQSNLCALMAHCGRGDEYIVGQMAHTYRWEGWGCGRAGQHPASALGAGGRWLDPAGRDRSRHQTRRRALCAHAAAGAGEHLGRPGAAAALHRSSLCAGARQGAERAHLDGARLFNAAVASGTPVAAIARHFDSVSVCFSKGLGTPAGSALVGSTELIARAHRIRKMLGGGMRQAGVLAAAALHALDHHVERLAEDHANARALAEGLQGVPGVSVQPPQTNIVFVDLVPEKAAGAVERLRAAGLWCTGLYRLRLVTHLDVAAADIPRALAILRAQL